MTIQQTFQPGDLIQIEIPSPQGSLTEDPSDHENAHSLGGRTYPKTSRQIIIEAHETGGFTITHPGSYRVTRLVPEGPGLSEDSPFIQKTKAETDPSLESLRDTVREFKEACKVYRETFLGPPPLSKTDATMMSHDVAIYGEGFAVDGKRVDPSRVTKAVKKSTGTVHTGEQGGPPVVHEDEAFIHHHFPGRWESHCINCGVEQAHGRSREACPGYALHDDEGGGS